MNKIDYQALREAAEKATCGVWSLEYGEERFDAGDALIHRDVVGYLPICRIEGAHPESGFDEDFQMEQQANAEFIAAANPATVLTLLDDLEAAKKRIAELEDEPVSQTYRLNELSGNNPVTPDGWISCSERMPNDAQWCVVDAADGYYVQCWSEGQGWLGDDISLRNCDVIRWMAIPEPPEQDGE
ncbi:TPA: DUF551 domain-containing protein [Escherichia coli]|uniref:ead/Ea22-like family protein n=1 Tax=Escherichia coli TaxID=562 RepID=UPI00128EFAA7|nr:ead/Ea22-like family protein [Escherichia coli]MQI89613.1 DUF551 domain-containing protein [Escherichia coli]HAO3399675.1 DUF551 domain-containing protein [Escherichia coli]HAO3494407.1 DUF551 domain-containing protein [Escherichia coli]